MQTIGRPLMLLGLMLLGVVGLSVFSQWSTIFAANDIDVERTSRAMRMAITSEVARVESVAEDNANWDDAANALYGRYSDQGFGWRSWGAVSDNENVYDTLFTIDDSGNMAFRFEQGKVSRADYGQLYGAGLKSLIKEVSGRSGAVGGLLLVGGVTRFVAVAKVTPTSPALAKKLANLPPIYLVVSRRISSTMLATIGNGLQLDNVALNDNSSGASIPLSTRDGKVIGQLGWSPDNPGFKAFKKASPTVGLALVLRVGALVLLLIYCFRFYAQLHRNALVDSLSRLPNRVALEFELERHRKRSQHIALAFLDLDGFKAVNDTYGHHVGDQLIRECATLASGLASECQMVARLGGDEFAVLACGVNAEEKLQRFSEMLLRRLSQPFHLQNRTIMIGVSIGLATSEQGSVDVTELMRRADIAMYASKRAGKMRMTVFDIAIDQQQAAAHEIDRRMRHALDNDEFQLVYQPLIGARDNKVVALEALLRWNDQDGNAVEPSLFVPIAEQTGLIDRIGLFVMERACRDAISWGDLMLTINVSAAQLRNPDFPQHLAGLLAETGFPAHRLELEITETYVVLQPEIANRVLSEIQKLGVRIALDDFGTGYASIGFLRQFNFDTLKIDRSLVVDAIADDGARAMVHASVVMARALGMAVVGEGIENEAQAHFMRVAGCDYLQGWLYSVAVAPTDVMNLVGSIEGVGPAVDHLNPARRLRAS